MLDEVVVFRKSGVVLWRHSWAAVKGDPINELIQKVLLEVMQPPSRNSAWRSAP
jgi:hypothetical protein